MAEWRNGLGKKVCIVGTAYALLLYLLHLGEEDWADTQFVFQDTIPHGVRSCFTNYEVIPLTGRRGMTKFFVLCRCAIIGVKLLFLRRRYRGARVIYAQDNLYSAPFIVGHQPYVLLSDGPMAYSGNELMYRSTANLWDSGFVRRLVRRIFGIPCYGMAAGQNLQCVGVLAGEIDPSSLIKDKHLQLVDFRMAWNRLSESRKKILLSAFNVDFGILDEASSKDVVLLTQPFASDGDISDYEQVQIYKRALDGLDISRLVIKPHPRDGIDYSSAFPGVTILPGFVPFQFLQLIGFRFKKAITISSSAISDVDGAEIVWIGNEVDGRIVGRYGNQHALYEKYVLCRSAKT